MFNPPVHMLASLFVFLVLPLAYSCNIYAVIWPTGYGTMDKLLHTDYTPPPLLVIRLIGVGVCGGPGCEAPIGVQCLQNKKRKHNSFHILIGAPCLRYCIWDRSLSPIIMAVDTGRRSVCSPVTPCQDR